MQKQVEAEERMQNSETSLSRRLFVAVSASFLMQQCIWAESQVNPVLCWRLQESGDSAREIIGKEQDKIQSRTGHASG